MEKSANSRTPNRPPTGERTPAVSLLIVIVAMGLLAGAAIHTSMPVFLGASAAIALWLLAFGARERIARARHR